MKKKACLEPDDDTEVVTESAVLLTPHEGWGCIERPAVPRFTKKPVYARLRPDQRRAYAARVTELVELMTVGEYGIYLVLDPRKPAERIPVRHHRKTDAICVYVLGPDCTPAFICGMLAGIRRERTRAGNKVILDLMCPLERAIWEDAHSVGAEAWRDPGGRKGHHGHLPLEAADGLPA